MQATIVRQSFRPTAALEQLAHGSPDAVVVVVDQRIVYVNPAMGVLLGEPELDALVGRRFLDFAPASRVEAWERLICDGLAAEEEALHAVLPLMRADGLQAPCVLSVAGSRLGARRAVQILAQPMARSGLNP